MEGAGQRLMKAAVYRRYGPPEVVQIEDVEKPVPNGNQLVIRIHATTVSAADWRMRRAVPFIVRFMTGLWRPGKIQILGMEFSGTVESVGRAVTRFGEGDRVFGSAGFKFGAHAEYLCLPEDSLLAMVEVVDAAPGSRAGALLFTRAGTLMSLPSDMKRLAAAGEPVAIAGQVASGGNLAGLAAASSQAVLAYVSGPRTGPQYVWRDRQGRYLGAAGPAGAVVCLSPDGKRLVGDHDSTRVLDLATGVATDLMAIHGGNANPIWSPDGRYIAISSGKRGWGVYRKPSTGAGEWEPLILTDNLTAPKSWSPDGRFILYSQIRPGTGADLMAMRAEPNATPFPVAQTPATEDQGQFSPDGRWVAYTSNETGLSEIYAIPFPPSPGGDRWRVSSGGGVMPRWRRDGKELFYVSPDSQMMAVDVSTRPVFQSGNPHRLFQTDIVDTGIRTGPMSWDIAPDGRFLIISQTSTDISITVLLNWRAGASN